MKKKQLIGILAVAAAILAVVILFIRHIGHKQTVLYGELLIKNPATGNGDIYSLNSRSFYGCNIYDTNMCFLDNSPYIFSGSTSIERYNINTGINETLYDTPSDPSGFFYTVDSLVPIDENKVLISVNGQIILYDNISGTEKIIMTDAAEFDFNRQSNDLYYRESSTGKIISYNFNTKAKNTAVQNGYYPKISNNNRYLAYRAGNELFVLDITTNRQWHTGYYVDYYCFSPDSRYIAAIKYEDHTLMPNHEILAWDFSNNKEYKISKGIPYGKIGSIDWR